VTAGSSPTTGDLHPESPDSVALPAPRGNAFWVVIALLVTGFLVSLAGVGLAIGVAFTVSAQPAPTVDTANAGLLAVLAIVLGGGGMCVGFGCLLFGWLGGSPYVSVGSHRSVVATTILAFAGGMLLGVGYLRIAGYRDAGMAEILTIVGAFVYGIFLVMVYLQGVRTGLVNRSTLGLSANQVAIGAVAGLVCGVLMIVFSGIYGQGLAALGIEQDQQEALRFIKTRTWGSYTVADLLAMGMIAIAAPVVEELFFRGYVFNAYDVYKGRRTAYIGSSLTFALIHGFPPLLPAFFIEGWMLAYVYRRSGTIVAPIVAHVLNNGLVVVLLSMGLQG
jgi:uncharacterized protein